MLLAVGAALIAVGADLLVDNGILIAQALGVPENLQAMARPCAHASRNWAAQKAA